MAVTTGRGAGRAHRRPVLAALVAVALLVPVDALACTCTPPPPPGEALAQASRVFTGRVTAIDDPSAGARVLSSADRLSVTFAVDEVWKGALEPTVTVATARDSASCGFTFAVGDEYLVYAHEGSVSLCSRTSLRAAATDDLAELGAGRAAAASDTANPAGGDGAAGSPGTDPSDDGERCFLLRWLGR